MLELTHLEGYKVCIDVESINVVIQREGYLEFYVSDVPFPIPVRCDYDRFIDIMIDNVGRGMYDLIYKKPEQQPL